MTSPTDVRHIVHPAGAAAAATDFSRAIARQVPGWEIRVEGNTMAFHDPDAEFGNQRWVAVVVGELVPTDLVPRPGPLIRALTRGTAIRIEIQMPNLVDGADIRSTINALRAMDALPEPAEHRPADKCGNPHDCTCRYGCDIP